jgi:hypothetical protein
MTPKDLFLNLNLKIRLNDPISVTTSILRVPLVHVVVGLGQVIQLMQIIHHPRGALLVISHDHTVEAGL